jgi:hypothetical protein
MGVVGGMEHVPQMLVTLARERTVQRTTWAPVQGSTWKSVALTAPAARPATGDRRPGIGPAI